MKNALPPMKIVAIQNYLLCELFLNRHILAQQTVEWSTWFYGWIWFTFTVAVCRPAVSTDVSPRILSSPVSATWCPFAINNSFSM